MAIIALQSPNNASSGSLRMACVDRIEGPASAATIISRLDNAIQRYGPGLNRLRMRRQQQELERRLRQEQDQAYRESLKADQEKVYMAALYPVAFGVLMRFFYERNVKLGSHEKQQLVQKKKPNKQKKSVWSLLKSDGNIYAICAGNYQLNRTAVTKGK